MKKRETSPNPSVAEIKCNRLNEFWRRRRIGGAFCRGSLTGKT